MSYNKSPFDNAPTKNVQLSYFNRSHEWKATFLPGYLTPCLLQETLPNDEWTINTEFMFRYQPLYYPVMARLTMRCDYFYIPNRILWPDNVDPLNPGWKKWLAQNIDTIPPKCNPALAYESDQFNNHVLIFMGLPLLMQEAGRSITIPVVNAFPPSAYLAVWDEYYRNAQLEDERWFALTEDFNANDDAFDLAFNYGTPPIVHYWPCLPSKWGKDYFTSALPTPQLGDAVQIPMTDGSIGVPTVWKTTDDSVPATGDIKIGVGGPLGHTESSASEPIYLDIQTNAANIRALREAEAYQSYWERILKVGERYRDFLKGLWGRDPEPGTVDVPVLIGSRFGITQIADVMTTASNDVGETGTSMTGDYRGQMNLYDNNNETIRYRCSEHGFILGILQVNPATSYGQGVNRLWRRDIQQDYALDMFAHIGDQEILKEEVMWNNVIAELDKNQETFGYIDRFGDYKYQNDIHIGNLNFNAGKSLHLGRIWNPNVVKGAIYDEAIQISAQFVTTSDVNIFDGTEGGNIRITDVWRQLPITPFSSSPTEGTIIAHLFHSIGVKRSLPVYSTPDLT